MSNENEPLMDKKFYNKEVLIIRTNMFFFLLEERII